MTELLTAFERHLVGRRRAARTVRAYGLVSAAFMATSCVAAITASDVEAFLGRKRRDGEPRAAASYNQELAALRALSAYAVREKFWAENPTQDVPFVREAPHDPVVLTAAELRALFRAVTEKAPARERAQFLAVVALLSQTALRIHELVALDVGQIDFPSATLLGVRGKGDTVHDLPLNLPATRLLTEWLREREKRAPPGERALFLSSRRQRLSIRTVENWFVGLRAAMGTRKKVTPHTLRHTAATLALAQGTDLGTVGELLRHTDLNTTRLYTHLVDTRRREAVRLLAATVPLDLLGPTGAPMASFAGTGNPANVPVPETPEGPTTSHQPGLDDQYGLSAA